MLLRKSDRVEISPLQLSAAAQEAEELSLKLGKPIRVMGRHHVKKNSFEHIKWNLVIGWYHSHPHITVVPSHVGKQSNSILGGWLIIAKYFPSYNLTIKFFWFLFLLLLFYLDVRTQANYQAMDPDFIGLIFSVFQQETNEKVNYLNC